MSLSNDKTINYEIELEENNSANHSFRKKSLKKLALDAGVCLKLRPLKIEKWLNIGS